MDPATNVKSLTLKPSELNKDKAYVKLDIEYNYLFKAIDETCFVDTQIDFEFPFCRFINKFGIEKDTL